MKDEWELGEEWERTFQAKKHVRSPGGMKEFGVFEDVCGQSGVNEG